MTEKLIVYTCVTGGYDTLNNPCFVTPNCKYVCFTDNPSLKSDIWETRQIPAMALQLDNIRKNRYVKLHPHLLFPEYECSIYIDGNISITGDVNTFITTCNLERCSIVIPKHPWRNCIYEEAQECIKRGKDIPEHIMPQIQRYKNEGFPDKYGLTQNNIIVRRHNDEACVRIMEEWWSELLTGSYRDQLSLMYVLWKHPDFCIHTLPDTTCNSEYFVQVRHN